MCICSEPSEDHGRLPSGEDRTRAADEEPPKDDPPRPPVWSSGVKFYPPSEHLWRIGGKWYDFNSFLPKHPGGEEVLRLARDRFEDATYAFEAHHHNYSRARAIIAKYEVPAPPQEVKIAAEFWNRSSGSKESTYQPSRLQKRKHQINSLAAQCAEQRVELEQRMRHGSKSKAQTAAKYGW